MDLSSTCVGAKAKVVRHHVNVAGSVYMEIDDHGIVKGFPRAIADGWPGMPSDIDAALTWPESVAYLYTNRRWKRKTQPARVYLFKVSRLTVWQNHEMNNL